MANPGVQPQGQPQQPPMQMSPEQLMTMLSQLAQSGGQLQQGQQPAQNAGQVTHDHLLALLPLLQHLLSPQANPGQGPQQPQAGVQNQQQGQPQQGQQQQPGPQQPPGQQQNPLAQILASFGIHLG